MHVSKLAKCAAWLLVAAVFGFGTMAFAADSEQKVQPEKAVEAAPAKTIDSTPAKPAAPGAVKASDPVQNPSDVVAKVNGQEIKAIELRRAQKVIMSGQKGMQIPPERQKEFEQQSLSQLLSAELLYQAGQKLTIKDLDKQTDAKLAQSRSRFGNEQDFAKAIKELEMDEKDLREYTRRDLIISNFIEQTIVPKITVTEEESKKFYDQNPDKFNRGETVKASHILIGVDPKASAEEKKKASEKAEKLRKDLAGGADFATLAKENSTCPSSQQGGDLGYFGKGQMVPPFEQAAFVLKPGEISDVVETQFGYHIIKVTDKKGAETVAFKEVKPRIEEFLKRQKVSAAVNDFLTEAKKTAKVEILMK
jgi:peptidyl-prolyl cis-trans isomerase C